MVVVVVNSEGMFAVHEHWSLFLQVDVEPMAEWVSGHAVDGSDGTRAYSALQRPTSGCSGRETEMNGRESCCSGEHGDLESATATGLVAPNCAPACKLEKEKRDNNQRSTVIVFGNGRKHWSISACIWRSTYPPVWQVPYHHRLGLQVCFHNSQLCASVPPCESLHIGIDYPASSSALPERDQICWRKRR